MTRIALAKGRILKETIPLLERCGFDTAALKAEGRSLIRPLSEGFEAMIVRSQDVPLYVARGACALGITGLDTVRERGAELYELMDLGIARCRMAVAGPPELDFLADRTRHWRVATKYPRITAEAFEERGRYFDLVYLGGTLETAPESGIADCIVDLVDTGATLAAHGLVTYETILDVSSRIVAHPTEFYRRRDAIGTLIERLDELLKGSAA